MIVDLVESEQILFEASVKKAVWQSADIIEGIRMVGRIAIFIFYLYRDIPIDGVKLRWLKSDRQSSQSLQVGEGCKIQHR